MRRPILKIVLSCACIAAVALVISNTNAPSSASGSNQSFLSQKISGVCEAVKALFNKDNPCSSAAGNSLMSILQTVRTQIELYKIQHNDQYPTLGNMQDWSALLEKTDAYGRFTSDGNCGPYLSSPPSNPFNNNSKTVAAGHPTKDAGWTYNERTGELHAVATQATLKATGLLEAHEHFEIVPEN